MVVLRESNRVEDEAEPAEQQAEQTRTQEQASVEVRESRLPLLGALTVFAVLGVLLRIGTNRLFNYSGAPLPFIVFPQFLGCFCMALLVFQKSTITCFSHTTYVGLTTGFCGSLTTFSSLLSTANQQLFNLSANQRGIFQSVLAYFSVLLAGFSASFSAYFFGKHLGALFEPRAAQLKYAKPKFCVTRPTAAGNQTNSTTCNFACVLDYCYVILSIATIATLVLLVIFVDSEQELLLAALFGPVGAIFRWYLAFLLNKKRPNFPLGTFAANVFGTTVLGVLFVLWRSLAESTLTCNAMLALSDGFCGGLTTISSFVAELFLLRRRHAYRYFSVTVLCAQLVLTLIFTLYFVLVFSRDIKGCG